MRCCSLLLAAAAAIGAHAQVNTAPGLTQAYSFLLPEGSFGPLGSVSIADSEGDPVGSVEVTFPPGNLFEVTPVGNMWQVSALQAFDFEQPQSFPVPGMASFDIQLNITDAPTRFGVAAVSNVATIFVTITDVNEPPQPVSGGDFFLAENTPLSTPVGNLTFADPEGDSVASVEVIGALANHFQVLQVGGIWQVFALTTIDFEQPAAFLTPGQITFDIPYNVTDAPSRPGVAAASERGAQLIILTDVNEPPQLADLQYDFSLPDLSPTGTVVGNISFVDPENDPISSVSVVFPAGGFFEVSLTNGSWLITTLRVLDRSQPQSLPDGAFSFDILLNFADAPSRTPTFGSPVPQSASGEGTVFVAVDPVLTGPNTPPQLGPVATFDLPENSFTNTPFATIVFSDAEHDDVRSVEVISPQGFIGVQGSSGMWQLVPFKLFDFETPAEFPVPNQPFFVVQLNVTDAPQRAGAVPASSTLSITITIQDINEHPALIDPASQGSQGTPAFFQLFLEDSTPAGVSFGNLDFVDPEGDAVGLVEVTFPTGNHFGVRKVNGLWQMFSTTDVNFTMAETQAPGQGFVVRGGGGFDVELRVVDAPDRFISGSSGPRHQPASGFETFFVNTQDVPSPSPSRTPLPTPTVTPSGTSAPTASATPAASPLTGAAFTALPTPSAAPTPTSTPVPGAVTRVGGSLSNVGEATLLGSETESTPATVLFAASADSTGAELYSQAFPAATSLAAELADGTASSSPTQLTRIPDANAVCFAADSTQWGTGVFCYTLNDRVFLAADILSIGGADPVILGADGATLWVSSTVSGTNALYAVTVDPTAPNTFAQHAAHADARLLTVTDSTVYYVAKNATGAEKLYSTADGIVPGVDTDRLTVQGMAPAGASLFIAATDADGAAELLLLSTTGSVTVLSQARRSLKGARALNVALTSPRFTTALGNDAFFAWRSASDAAVDALWRVTSDGTATEMAAFPSPTDAGVNAVVSASALASAGGALFAQTTGTVGSASVTEIFKWVSGAWLSLGSVDVSAGREVGTAPTGLKAVSTNAISFSAVLGSDSTASLVILDVVRTAVAAAVVPSPSATPTASPAAAAQAAQPDPEEAISGALVAGISLIAVLVLLVVGFFVWRMCCTGSRKTARAIPAATSAPATPAVPAKADQV